MTPVTPEAFVHSSEHVIILAPTGQDAKLIANVLNARAINTEIFNSVNELCQRLDQDCGTVVMTEEALSKAAVEQLTRKLSEQAVWSDLPLVVLTSSGETGAPGTLRILKSFGAASNISLIERPLRPITLESMIQGALRARRRQYQVRELLRVQVEATRVRDEFISVASHELRTPLTSLKLMTQMNQRMITGKSPVLLTKEKIERLIEFTDNQVGRLTRLVEDMLDVSKIGSGKFIIRKSEVDFAKLVDQAVERIHGELEAVGCAIELDLPECLMLSIDQDRFEQVVTNLLTNIIRYAPGAPVRISLKQTAENVSLTVSDQGPGIPADRLEKVFDRFERATSSNNISGLGLGLYICRQIVSSHGGTITIESEFGAGTRFNIVLPLQGESLPFGESGDANLKPLKVPVARGFSPDADLSSAPN